jgi:signal transduction histidine kinase
MGWVELIKSKLNKEASEEMHTDIERIREIIDRFARIGDKPHLEPNDIEPLIVHTIDFMRHRAPAKIDFITEIKENSKLLLDPTLISWVLENLIRNGIDAIGRRQGSITITAGIQDNSHNYEITVTDTGSGIRPGHTREVFRTGFSTKKHGWGIGLALSKRVVEQLHKGKLKVKQSKPGKTVMSFTLPIWHE